MKTLSQIIEKFIINKDTKVNYKYHRSEKPFTNGNIKLPQMAGIAYDENGIGYEIRDYINFLRMSKSNILHFIDKYNDNAFKRFYENEFQVTDYKEEYNCGTLLMVAAKKINDNTNNIKIFLWGRDLSFENKKYKNI